MEEKKDATYFKQLAHQLMFDLSDEEAENIVNEFDVLTKQMKLLDAVNTDGVEEMIYPFEDETSFIREDEVTHVISQDDALANVNKKINNVENIEFILGKVEDKLDFISNNNIDTVIVDPPRSGLHKKVIPILEKISPKTIIYVSCDPITMARDIKLLSNDYELVEVTPYDMFPNTYHVECVCVLNLK